MVAFAGRRHSRLKLTDPSPRQDPFRACVPVSSDDSRPEIRFDPGKPDFKYDEDQRRLKMYLCQSGFHPADGETWR